MRAMILAAGRGERMRPLTDHMPKAMIRVSGKPLIQHHVENLVQAGIGEIVVNHARFGDQIRDCLGDGRQFNAVIQYSAEGDEPLETGGGIYRALLLLGDAPFLVINVDVWTDYPLQCLPTALAGLAHLVLVANPPHRPDGDFALDGDKVKNHGIVRYTYSGIGVYCTEFFNSCTGGAFPLAPLLRQAIGKDKVTGEVHTGLWMDIGAPDRLESLLESLK
jgi:N-acetyl-alpha-D-muramate 1-phosphate uridylyltransferase